MLTRRTFLKTLIGSGLLAMLGSGYAWAEGHRFAVNRHRVTLAGLKAPLRVAHLTDLHFDRWRLERDIQPWLEATGRENPELILITGDFVSRLLPLERMQSLANLLGTLSAPLGVWAVMGNHDYQPSSGSVSTPEFITLLERKGIKVLNNSNAQVREDLWLAGMDDLTWGTPDLGRTLEGLPQEIVSQGVASLLMSHNPDILPKVPAWVGLTLSGHTHGGQVRLPGVETLYNVSRYGERFQMGFTVADQPFELGAKGFVSRGLGTGGFPVRTFCPAELVMLECVPQVG